MVPILVAIGFVITWLILPKNGSKTAVVVPTPFNTPVGITTGFGAPSVATDVNPLPNRTMQNQPSTSGSGVPDYSIQTQEFNTAQPKPIASFAGVPQFYNPSQHMLSFPGGRQRTAPDEEKSNCGCSASKGKSDCGVVKRRTMDAGCLAVSKKRQLENTPQHFVDSWADNVLSSHWSAYDAVADQLYAIQKDNPQSFDLTVPAAPVQTAIGLTPKGYHY